MPDVEPADSRSMVGDAALRQRKPDVATNGQASPRSMAPEAVGSKRVPTTGTGAAGRKRRDVLSGMGTIALFFALVVRCLLLRCHPGRSKTFPWVWGTASQGTTVG